MKKLKNEKLIVMKTKELTIKETKEVEGGKLVWSTVLSKWIYID